MKLLIYGGKGWIGNQFVQLLIHTTYKLGNSRVDNKETLLAEITEYQPTHIISFIGRTHGENFTTIDYLEQPGKLKENIKDNLFAPISLALLCKDQNIHLTI